MAPVVDQFMFGIIVPVEIGGESRYVLGRSQDQHVLARLVAANELPPGWLAVIADAAQPKSRCASLGLCERRMRLFE
jgi:hypothetical protein